ncbi:AraC family transcriptional regulator [Chitinophaga sp. Cy-1792]|uniref:AraC family transcriptional regulator n=1 Tax=Chitinophaga sp. Cy-1792 TaxID=2608339 RepID=UPI001420C269|nr:AraC family transcriptional regulator [Chitinophaga sp. Cy-1792]NIG57551.1 AraC family transcriptional regulator [Chitinophaga sp. Cy-1792]
MIRKTEGFQGQRMIVLPRNLLTAHCEQHPIMSALYITDIGYYPKARFHHRKRPQGAEQHILIYCTEGKGQVTIGGNSHVIRAGDCFLLPRNLDHEYRADIRDPWTIYWVHFLGTSTDSLVEMALKTWQDTKTNLKWSAQRIDFFDLCYNQLQRGNRPENLTGANMYLPAFLASCLYPEHTVTADRQHDVTDLAITYMKNNLHQMLTLQQIAAAVNLSQSHFSALFKNNTGISPIEYFNQMKIQDACQYLLFTTLRIKEIAAKLGMEDPYYFSRLFTKIMGVSPNQYREKKI